MGGGSVNILWTNWPSVSAGHTHRCFNTHQLYFFKKKRQILLRFFSLLWPQDRVGGGNFFFKDRSEMGTIECNTDALILKKINRIAKHTVTQVRWYFLRPPTCRGSSSHPFNKRHVCMSFVFYILKIFNSLDIHKHMDRVLGLLPTPNIFAYLLDWLTFQCRF